MSSYEEVAAAAMALTPGERDRLAREISATARHAGIGVGMLAAAPPPAPQSSAWVKAERGHAVLATDTGPAEADIPAGPEAIAGMWVDMRGAQG